MGKIADIEAEVFLVDSYYTEDEIGHVFELDVLKRFYHSVRAILDFDTLGEN